jgi:hypothetical protein
MTEHGWPDHHDDHGYHDEQHDPLHDPDAVTHEPDAPPLPEHDELDLAEPHHDAPEPEHEPDAALPPAEHTDAGADLHAEPPEPGPSIGADPDALPDDLTPDTVFPPPLDVGELPEPVDGFPWIDTASLGTADPAGVHDVAAEPVDPHELADYAGVHLPPGADPWAVLADAEDPATGALARWWSGQQPT